MMIDMSNSTSNAAQTISSTPTPAGKRFEYQQNGNMFWTLEDATYDASTGKVTGRCVKNTHHNRLFHATSESQGYDHGKPSVSLPPYGRIEQYEYDNGRA